MYKLRSGMTPPEERVFDEVVEEMVRDGLMVQSKSEIGGWILTEQGEKVVYP